MSFFNIRAVIKRNSDIASLFQKREAKKATTAAAISNSSPDPIEHVVEVWWKNRLRRE